MTAPKIQIHSNFDGCLLKNSFSSHYLPGFFLAVLLCKMLESRWVFKSVHRYNVLIFHSPSPGESVRALTVLIDVWSVNSGNPLSFPVCSNKIQRDFVGVFNKTIIPRALVGYEIIIAHTRMHRQTWYRFSALCPKQRIFNNYSLKSRWMVG